MTESQSELDRWFPRDDKPEEKPEKPPEQGVIEGAKRNPPLRYGRRWWQIRHDKEKDDEHEHV